MAQSERNGGRGNGGLTTAEREDSAGCGERTASSGLSGRSSQRRRPGSLGRRTRPCEGFRFVSDHQADYPIATMRQPPGVSPSGYYAWRKRSHRSGPRPTPR